MNKYLKIGLSVALVLIFLWMLSPPFRIPPIFPPPCPLAITHVTLIDGTGSGPQMDATILIKEGYIEAVGSASSLKIPSGFRIIDTRGKFAIPGLEDLHVHLTGAGEPGGSRKFILPLLLANGVTSVRDMGGDLKTLSGLSLWSMHDRGAVPDIEYAGPYLDGDPPSFQPSIVVRNAPEARAAVLDLWNNGTSFYKVQSNLSRDAYFAIAEEARREKKQFAGHVPDRVSAAEASDAGQASIEHLTGVLLGCSSKEELLREAQFAKGGAHANSLTQSHGKWQQELLDSYSEPKCSELRERFLRNHTWQVPTLVTLRNVAFAMPQEDHSGDPEMEFVPRKLREIWADSRSKDLHVTTKEDAALRARLLERSREVVRYLHSGGVAILAGTDTAAPYVFPGFSLHEELALLVQCGLTPMEALQAATRDAALFRQRVEFEGTIAPRMQADIVLLDANPIDNIRNTRKIFAIVHRGRYLDRAALDELLASVRKYAREN